MHGFPTELCFLIKKGFKTKKTLIKETWKKDLKGFYKFKKKMN